MSKVLCLLRFTAIFFVFLKIYLDNALHITYNILSKLIRVISSVGRAPDS